MEELICRNCGHSNPADIRTCEECNGKLADTSAATDGPGKSHRDAKSPTTSFTELTFPLRSQYNFLENLPTTRGGPGIVLCQDRDDDTLVTVRLGNDEQIGTNEAVATFLQRSDIDPRYVLPILETGHVGEFWYEVYKYMECGSLYSLIQQQEPRLAEDQVDRILDQLAGCIKYIHDLRLSSHGLIHRDLKPSDILISNVDPLTLVLADFRRSVLLVAPSEMVSIPRFAAYAPPGEYTAASDDWWALGMIILELITGDHPFRLSDGRWMDNEAIRHLLATTSIASVGEVRDLRWRQLVRGLLTRGGDYRWGSVQIREWQTGESPFVHDDAAGSVATSGPSFSFCGKSYTDPRILADSMGRHWNEAGDVIVVDEDFDELARWLNRHNPSRNLRLAIDSCRSRDLPLDRLIATLITEMAPDIPPRFRNFLIDRNSLGNLAWAAERGDKFERYAVHCLRESKALIAYSSLPGYTDYSDLDSSWRRNVTAVLSGAKGAPELRELVTSEYKIQTEAALLLALNTEGSLVGLRREADEANSRGARTQRWFRDLADRRTPRNLEPAQLWLTITAAEFARRQHADLEQSAREVLANSNGPKARYVAAVEMEQVVADALSDESIQLAEPLPPIPAQGWPSEQAIALAKLLRVASARLQDLAQQTSFVAMRYRAGKVPRPDIDTPPAKPDEYPRQFPILLVLATVAVVVGVTWWIQTYGIDNKFEFALVMIFDIPIIVAWFRYLAPVRERLTSIAVARDNQAEYDHIADDLNVLASHIRNVGTRISSPDTLTGLRDLFDRLRECGYPITIDEDVFHFRPWPESPVSPTEPPTDPKLRPVVAPPTERRNTSPPYMGVASSAEITDFLRQVDRGLDDTGLAVAVIDNVDICHVLRREFWIQSSPVLVFRRLADKAYRPAGTRDRLFGEIRARFSPLRFLDGTPYEEFTFASKTDDQLVLVERRAPEERDQPIRLLRAFLVVCRDPGGAVRDGSPCQSLRAWFDGQEMMPGPTDSTYY